MENERDRVLVMIAMESGLNWQLITPRINAEVFEKEWGGGTKKIIYITGVTDHRDANNVVYKFKRERIECVQILEVKL